MGNLTLDEESVVVRGIVFMEHRKPSFCHVYRTHTKIDPDYMVVVTLMMFSNQVSQVVDFRTPFSQLYGLGSSTLLFPVTYFLKRCVLPPFANEH